MGMKYAEQTFNMSMFLFFYLRRPSKWDLPPPPPPPRDVLTIGYSPESGEGGLLRVEKGTGRPTDVALTRNKGERVVM